MTCGAEGTPEASQIRGSERIRQGECGNDVVMGGSLAGEVELTLQVLLSDCRPLMQPCGGAEYVAIMLLMNAPGVTG